jgi:hypothetical protein
MEEEPLIASSILSWRITALSEIGPQSSSAKSLVRDSDNSELMLPTPSENDC